MSPTDRSEPPAKDPAYTTLCLISHEPAWRPKTETSESTSDTLQIVFHSSSVPLAGCFHRNTNSLETRQPVVIVTGSWLTVKEQMPATYARAFAELGYTAFTFDFAGFGESDGAPRQAELPARKIGDIMAAAEFVATMSFSSPGAVALLGVCASAQYGLAALARGARIDSFVSVAGWFHDSATVAPLYGGTEGIAPRLAAAARDVAGFLNRGTATMVPAYNPGDPSAGMSFELDYYANPARGAVPAWKNEMAEMTWFPWLAFDGLRAAAEVTTPTLLVHGDGCMLPANAQRVHADLRGPKGLVWREGFQVDFYDQPQLVTFAVAAAHEHFQRTLSLRPS